MEVSAGHAHWLVDARGRRFLNAGACARVSHCPAPLRFWTDDDSSSPHGRRRHTAVIVVVHRLIGLFVERFDVASPSSSPMLDESLATIVGREA